MKKFMILTLSLILVCAALTGCGCSANISGTTEPSASATMQPTAAPTTAPTAAPTTEPTKAPATAPTAPSAQPTQPSVTENTMPGIIDGTSGQDGTVQPDGDGATEIPDGARHSRGMRRR